MTSLFPIAQIFLSLGAAAVYAFAGDWKHVTYWLAAAILTAVVTSL